MVEIILLNEKELKEKLAGLADWFYSNKSLSKEYILKDFSTAIAFIVKIGLEAQKVDHHPDLLLHSWNKVKVTLSTQSLGGITLKDIQLAYQIERIDI
jgi:4a-hydroxytetrahydrobiopterin dehydratase